MGARATMLPALAAAFVAATATAAPTAVPVQANCNATAITVLFWPKGHPVVRSLGFPVSPRAHVELFRYAGAKTYTSANQIGLAEASAAYRLSPRCARQKPTTGLTNVPVRTTTTGAAVSCSFSGSGNVQMQKIGAVTEVKLLDGKKVVLRAKVAPNGSTLAASTQQCRVGVAPR